MAYIMFPNARAKAQRWSGRVRERWFIQSLGVALSRVFSKTERVGEVISSSGVSPDMILSIFSREEITRHTCGDLLLRRGVSHRPPVKMSISAFLNQFVYREDNVNLSFKRVSNGVELCLDPAESNPHYLKVFIPNR